MRASILLTLLALCPIVPTAHAQLVVQENFAYPTGDLVGRGNWVQTGTVNTNPIQVTANNLTFPNYRSVTGNAVSMTTGQDANLAFTQVTSGSVYVAALVRISTAAATSDYFLHLAPDAANSTDFRGRVGAVQNGAGFSFTLTKSATASIVTESTVRNFNETYLIVLKYTINPAGATDDPVALYVFRSTDAYTTEPATPTLAATDVSSGDINPGTVNLRQGGSSTAPTVIVDGIRVTRSFASIATSNEMSPAAAAARLDVVGAQPAATLRVRLTPDVPGAVRLDAYDLLGRRVETLLDATLGAGEAREVTLGGLPAGVYVLRATGSGFSATRPVVLR
jgi:hypothetical protein